ncbi:Thioredoxin domain-containing protein [Burkholderia ubonensis]|nr:SCO1/SenC family protein [Burkholderia ubonensis]
MKGTAKSTAGAFVLAGAALAAAAAWGAPEESAAGSVMENAVESATGSAAPGANGNATESATGNATGNVTSGAADDARPNAAGSATENDAGSMMETPVEQAPDAAPANTGGKAADEATESAIDNAVGNAAEGATGSATESAAEGADMHMHHVVAPGTTHSMADYALPPVELVRDDGKTVSLVDELNDGRPVILTFIYTSCTTICPMISQTLERLQGELGGDRDKVHIVSISIDPEEDTPARLRAYAARFGAGPEWQHYTGTVDASIAAQRAFNVYRGDKMNHVPVAFLRAAPGRQWMRIDGFATPSELLAAYRDVVASD